MYTDGYLTEGVSDNYEIAPALGLIKGSACPHYDDRSADFNAALRDAVGESLWYCIENRSAIVFENESLIGGISCGGSAYTVKKSGDTTETKPITTQILR